MLLWRNTIGMLVSDDILSVTFWYCSGMTGMLWGGVSTTLRISHGKSIIQVPVVVWASGSGLLCEVMAMEKCL